MSTTHHLTLFEMRADRSVWLQYSCPCTLDKNLGSTQNGYKSSKCIRLPAPLATVTIVLPKHLSHLSSSTTRRPLGLAATHSVQYKFVDVTACCKISLFFSTRIIFFFFQNGKGFTFVVPHLVYSDMTISNSRTVSL